MAEQQTDNEDDKVLPGTLFPSDESSTHDHQHPHHQHPHHRHSLNSTPPSLVEVRSDLLRKKQTLFVSISFIYILMVPFDIRLYLNSLKKRV
jgi:hypothetical protein